VYVGMRLLREQASDGIVPLSAIAAHDDDELRDKEAPRRKEKWLQLEQQQ